MQLLLLLLSFLQHRILPLMTADRKEHQQAYISSKLLFFKNRKERILCSLIFFFLGNMLFVVLFICLRNFKLVCLRVVKLPILLPHQVVQLPHDDVYNQIRHTHCVNLNTIVAWLCALHLRRGTKDLFLYYDIIQVSKIKILFATKLIPKLTFLGA